MKLTQPPPKHDNIQLRDQITECPAGFDELACLAAFQTRVLAGLVARRVEIQASIVVL